MPKRLVSNKVKQNFKKITQQLVLDLSQSLTIVQESPVFIDCPNCIYDSINKKSANIFDASFVASTIIFASTDQSRTISPISFTSGRCPVCIGEGQLFTNKEVCIPAMINFVRAGDDKEAGLMNTPAGREGTSLVTVKTLSCHYELILNNFVFMIHDGIKCEKARPPIVRGLGGLEAVTEVWLQTTEIGQRSSAKFKTVTDREDDPRRRIKGPTDLRILRGQQKGQ